MESSQKLQLIDQAIQKLLSEKRNRKNSGDSILQDDNDQLLLSRLLSELESLKEDGTLEQSEGSTEEEAVNSCVGGEEESKNKKASQLDSGSTEIVADEIVKELKQVKRQNLITHCLLSVMIVLTVAWQLSEVSLIMKVRDGLSHPFRSFGGMLIGMLKSPGNNAEDTEKQHSSAKQQQMEASSAHLVLSVPPLKMPELPHMDLGFNGEKHP